MGVLLDALELTIGAVHVVPGRPPTYASIPTSLGRATRGFLEAAYPRGLYRHQALAMDALANGETVCVETPTASGKTLVFHAGALETLANEDGSKVIVLYPAKALIEDQLWKWHTALEGTPYRVARIDGTVALGDRMTIASRADILLMTPDVVHAWMMSRLSEAAMRELLGAVRLLILDEAHVYDGIFGSNTACFLRRLQVAIDACRPAGTRELSLLSATATIGAPAKLIERLTGRPSLVVGAEVDGSARHPKRIMTVGCPAADRFESVVRLLRGLASTGHGRFLAFADSRRMVEQLCAVVEREDAVEGTRLERDDDITNATDGALYSLDSAVLPYRAGYEESDRTTIQRALAEGRLRGVVSTSALELGIDIGEIDTVVCVGVPPSMKAFWQRAGRAGRQGPADVLMIDVEGRAPCSDAELAAFLAQPMEPNWLYLENRYLQYAQALCAARELADLGVALDAATPFASLPEAFRSYVANELDPREPIAPDLFALKQRAAASAPQYAFPLRTGIEESFEVHMHRSSRMGELTFPQALREAYPGGIYMHLARAHRVCGFNMRQNRIEVVRCAYSMTRPLLQTMIFPDFGPGVIDARTGDEGFIAEVSLQVSQRLNGFVEVRGRTREEHLYGPGSPHAQRPIGRFFQSTGICWWFGDDANEPAESMAQAILEAGCERFGLHTRDVDVGRFHANRGFGRTGPLRGLCIFDSTCGSLRLTSRFLGELPSILEGLVGRSADLELRAALQRLLDRVTASRPLATGGMPEPRSSDASTMIVVAPGSPAMLMNGSSCEEITVGEVVYTPNGFMYRVVTEHGRRMVAVSFVQPILGASRMQRFDPETYDAEDLGHAGE